MPITISGTMSPDERRDRRPVEEPGPDAVEDVGRRRELREHLHPPRQHARPGSRRPDTSSRHDWSDERHLGAALHVEQRQDRGHHADADEAERAQEHEDRRPSPGSSTPRSSCGEEQPGARPASPPCGRGRSAIAYRHEPSSWVQRRTGAMNVYSSVPSQRSTAIVSAIQREDDGEVVPEDGADDEREEQAVVARRGADQADRERAGDGVDEERQLPPPVPAGEEEVALDEGVGRLQLVRDESQRSVPFRRVRPGSGSSPDPGSGRGGVIPATREWVSASSPPTPLGRAG